MDPTETRQESGATKGAELSPVKREQILTGARAVFRELGYERASVDAIAARAGVSKATVYNHFHDKKALFLAAFGAENEGVRRKFLSLVEEPSGDIEADLRQIAEQLLRLMTGPRQVQRFRVVAGVSERFPELGGELYQCSVKVGRERLQRFLARAADAGQLEIDDAEAAAIDFHALVAGELWRKRVLGVVEKVTDEEVERNVERAVRTFLRAYGRRRETGQLKVES